MIKQGKSGIEFYQSEKLLQHESIGHFFSTRNSDFTKLNLLVLEFNLNESSFIIGKQTHSDQIAVIDQRNKNSSFIGVDAFITREKGICIAVKTADCTPILLFDPVQNIIAAIHSGWRGTIQNISGKTISKMIEEYQVQPENIIAAIGPCIGQQNYEVGEEVAEQFRQIFPTIRDIVSEPDKPGDKPKISVRNAIYQQLIHSGVQAKNIDLSQECTYTSSHLFHSARREGAKTGRMVNGIWLK